MSFSYQQPSAYSNLPAPADSSNFESLERISSNIDRSILGIPDENDEFTRGLIFYYDPSTGQPSVHSTSEESNGLNESTPYEPSLSSDNSGSQKILTPQSVSDAAGCLQPPIASPSSVGSYDGHFSDCGAAHGHFPSLSAHASAGASQAAPSPRLSPTPTHLPQAENSPTTTMPPTVNPPLSEPICSFEDVTDPRAIIAISPQDIICLEEIVGLGRPSPMDTPAIASDQRDLVYPRTDRVAPPHSDIARVSEPSHFPMSGTHTRTLAMRKQKVSHPRSNPTRVRASTKDANHANERAIIEKKRRIRQIGVCLPCLVNHESCDLDEDLCSKCMISMRSLTLSKMQKTPCVRFHLSEAVLFRIGALSFPEGPPESIQWVSKRNVSVKLYNVGPANPSVSPDLRPHLEVICREFSSTPRIRSSKSWTKGSNKIDIHLPNYAIPRHQYSVTAKRLDVLVEAEYDRLVAELAIGQDDIVSRTLAEAVRQADRCWPIKGALQLSILSRLASKSFNISGQNVLGIAEEQDPECPYYRRRPIPPLLDAQLDFFLRERMKALKKLVLGSLRRMIAGRGRKSWFRIYLTISILLLNLESVYQNQCRQIRRYSEPTQQQDMMLQRWEHAACNLIAHFRAVCRGHIPLNQSWTKEDQDAAEVDDQSLDFISHLNGIAQTREEDLRETSNASSDTPLVWVSALFAP